MLGKLVLLHVAMAYKKMITRPFLVADMLSLQCLPFM